MMPFAIQPIAALAFILALSACATSLTVERISPTEKQSDFVGDVTSAHRQASGAVVLCVVGEVAHTPWPFADQNAAFSLTLPSNPSVTLRKSVRREIPRYPVKQADVGGPCGEKPDGATPLTIHRIAGDPYSLDYDALMPLVGEQAGAWIVESGYKSIFYVDESPRFEGRRAVWIRAEDREVAGQPAYLLLLPVAVVWDVLMVPFYLLMALGGGIH